MRICLSGLRKTQTKVKVFSLTFSENLKANRQTLCNSIGKNRFNNLRTQTSALKVRLNLDFRKKDVIGTMFHRNSTNCSIGKNDNLVIVGLPFFLKKSALNFIIPSAKLSFNYITITEFVE